MVDSNNKKQAMEIKKTITQTQIDEVLFNALHKFDFYQLLALYYHDETDDKRKQHKYVYFKVQGDGIYFEHEKGRVFKWEEMQMKGSKLYLNDSIVLDISDWSFTVNGDRLLSDYTIQLTREKQAKDEFLKHLFESPVWNKESLFKMKSGDKILSIKITEDNVMIDGHQYDYWYEFKHSRSSASSCSLVAAGGSFEYSQEGNVTLLKEKYEISNKNIQRDEALFTYGKKHFWDSTCFNSKRLKHFEKGVIQLPDYITRIEANTFAGCKGLTSVIIPDGVAEIPDNCFDYCTGLTHITLPNSIRIIGKHSFKDCVSLSEITIPAGVRSIPEGCFENCRSLTKITLPNSINKIEKQAFKGCQKLYEIVIPDGLTEIPAECFMDCTMLSSVVIPVSVTRIEERAFCSCHSITKCIVPAGVKEISEGTFKNCKNLDSIIIPSTVCRIGEQAFYSCENLKQFEIPSEVKIIESECFMSCKSLQSINLRSSQVSILQAEAFKKCSSLKEVILPPTLEQIEKEAFRQCSLLNRVVIPKSVKSLDSSVFHGCVLLSLVEIENGNSLSLGTGTFACCYNLTNIVLPASVNTLPSLLFDNCHNLTTVYLLGNKVETEGLGVFESCDKLKKIYKYLGQEKEDHDPEITVIPDNLVFVEEGYKCFNGCRGFTHVIFEASIDRTFFTFYGCFELKTFEIKGRVKTVGGGTFKNCYISTFILHDSSIFFESFAFGGGRTIPNLIAPPGFTMPESAYLCYKGSLCI